jgi:hypothetical protein
VKVRLKALSQVQIIRCTYLRDFSNIPGLQMRDRDEERAYEVLGSTENEEMWRENWRRREEENRW